MTVADLRTLPSLPGGVRDELVALWHDARGDWTRAHEVVQDLETREAAWVHAYLHRKEGDASNARYWYTRASRPVCRLSLEQEWTQIAETLLGS